MVAVIHQSVVYDTRVTFGFRSVLGTRTISIEESFVSGVSITHGPPGTTQHVWTFVGALKEIDNQYNGLHNCPCSIICHSGI